jgi:hypothetical protein
VEQTANDVEDDAVGKDIMAEDNTPLELVKTCGPTEAEMIREVLSKNGIECTLQGEIAAQTLPATGDLDEVRIWVYPSDANRANELIEAFFETDVDPDVEQDSTNPA